MDSIARSNMGNSPKTSSVRIRGHKKSLWTEILFNPFDLREGAYCQYIKNQGPCSRWQVRNWSAAFATMNNFCTPTLFQHVTLFTSRTHSRDRPIMAMIQDPSVSAGVTGSDVSLDQKKKKIYFVPLGNTPTDCLTSPSNAHANKIQKTTLKS